MIYALLLALLLGVALNLDVAADPPLGPVDLEGQILLGARALLPDAGVPLGEWAPHILAPIHVGIHAVVFRIAGRGLVSARRTAGVLAVLVVLLFFDLTRRASGNGPALLATVFLVVNPLFASLSRTALPAVTSILCMLLAVRAWTWGRSPSLAALSGAAVAAAGVAHLPHTLFFLAAGAFTALCLRLHAWKMPWAGATRRRLALALWGGLVVLAVYGIAVLLHREESLRTWRHFGVVDARLMVSNLVLTPIYISRMIARMPVIALLALGYFLLFAKDVVRPIARHRPVDETRLWFLGWLLAGVPYFALSAAPSLDALTLLVPPLCALAGEGLARLYRVRRIARPRLDVMIVMLLIALCVWFAVAWGLQWGLGRLDPQGLLARHPIRTLFGAAFAVWIGATVLLGWLYLRWRHFTVPLRPVPVGALVVLLGLGNVVPGAVHAARWWAHRTHEIRDATSLVSDLPEDALVAGSWAPLLTLGASARATLLWPGLNDAPASWHVEVTHLLLMDGGESRPEVPPRLLFPEARALRAATLAGRTITLYAVR